MRIHRPKNRHVLTALLTLAALGGISACSGDLMGPEAPADLAASYATVAAPTAQNCTKVDGVWVCAESTTTGGSTTDGPTCILIAGVWVCENES